jgi:hypothetical protein
VYLKIKNASNLIVQIKGSPLNYFGGAGGAPGGAGGGGGASCLAAQPMLSMPSMAASSTMLIIFFFIVVVCLFYYNNLPAICFNLLIFSYTSRQKGMLLLPAYRRRLLAAQSNDNFKRL